MSINMDSTSEVTYADHEIETFAIEYRPETPAENGVVEAQYKPLDRRGGLDSDEIAELTSAVLVLNVGADPGAGQTGGGLYEFRGAFGANIDIEDHVFSADSGTDLSLAQQNIVQELEPDGAAGGTATLEATTETGVFAEWDLAAGVDDSANQVQEIDFRQRFGRGPVLDSTDDLSLVATLIQQADTDLVPEAHAIVHLAYDVATVEGVRDRFSLPGRVE